MDSVTIFVNLHTLCTSLSIDVIQEVDIDKIELPVEESDEEDYYESMVID